MKPWPWSCCDGWPATVRLRFLCLCLWSDCHYHLRKRTICSFQLTVINMTMLLKVAATLALTLSIATSWADEPEPANKYQAVYVSKVAVEADMDRTSPEEVKYYADIETEATTKITQWFKDEGFTIADTPDAATDGLAIINTKVLFNAGNRALRWVGSFMGAGKATADVTMEAIDSKYGTKVTSQNAKDSLRIGNLGGSASSMLMGTIGTAWNYVVADINELK